MDLDDPELTLSWRSCQGPILVLVREAARARRFAVGSSGRVLALLSGRDRLAGGRLAHDEARLPRALVNFHAFPLQDRTMIDKVRDLARVLTRWQFRTRLFLVPFGARAADDRGRPAPRRCGSCSTAASCCASPRRWPRAAGPRRWSPARASARWRRRRSTTCWSSTRPSRMPVLRPLDRHGQGGDHRRGATPRHVRDQHPPRPGLLPALRAARARPLPPSSQEVRRPRTPSTSRRWWARPWRRLRAPADGVRRRSARARYNPPRRGQHAVTGSRSGNSSARCSRGPTRRSIWPRPRC